MPKNNAKKNSKNIYEKLLEVRKACPYLRKEHKGYQFKYVSSSQILGALRQAMDEQGLLLIPQIAHHVFWKKGEGSKEHLTELSMTFTWVNAENPEEKIICPWYAQGIDPGEKGVGKALTYAEKYFLLKFFNIPTDEDDPDAFQEKIRTDVDVSALLEEINAITTLGQLQQWYQTKAKIIDRLPAADKREIIEACRLKKEALTTERNVEAP